jgi:hypothetical protein
LTTCFGSSLCFDHLDFGCTVTMGKTDNRTNENVSSGQDLLSNARNLELVLKSNHNLGVTT